MGSRNKLDILSKISQIHMPVLLIIGTQDTLTPSWMKQTLFEHANPPKQIHFVPGANHNDLWDVGGHELIARLNGFVSNVH